MSGKHRNRGRSQEELSWLASARECLGNEELGMLLAGELAGGAEEDYDDNKWNMTNGRKAKRANRWLRRKQSKKNMKE